MSVQCVAETLGVSRDKVLRLRAGKRDADFATAEALLDLTNGAVTPNDLHNQRRAWLAARGDAPSLSIPAAAAPSYLMEAAE